MKYIPPGQVLIGGHRAGVGGEFTDGYFFEPTVLKGHNKMRVFQEEIFGPVLAVTTFTGEADALAIANDTLYGPALACGRAMDRGPAGWDGPSRPAGSGRTATTSTRQARRSAATRAGRRFTTRPAALRPTSIQGALGRYGGRRLAAGAARSGRCTDDQSD